jgi:hypothetical protein
MAVTRPSDTKGRPFRAGMDGFKLTMNMGSGRRIVDILNKNPRKDPEKYEEEDIQHMRKVVSYWFVLRSMSKDQS